MNYEMLAFIKSTSLTTISKMNVANNGIGRMQTID